MKKKRGRPRISDKETIIRTARRSKEEIEITKRIRDKEIKGLETESDILYEAVSLLEDEIKKLDKENPT